MGRQLHFHTYGEDVRNLIGFISSNCELIVALRYSDGPGIDPIRDPASEVRGMTLWNRDLLPELSREKIKLNDGGERFYIDYLHAVSNCLPVS
jgi:hypothetical protein